MDVGSVRQIGKKVKYLSTYYAWKICVCRCYEDYRRNKGVTLTFLISVLDGGERSASHLGHFTLRKEDRYALNNKLDGPKSRSGHFEEEKIFPWQGF